MHEAAMNLIRRLQQDWQVDIFASKLTQWLMEEAQPDGGSKEFTSSRAKALLRSNEQLEESLLRDFNSLVQHPPAAKVALYELIKETRLVQLPEVEALIPRRSSDGSETTNWLTLILAAYCRKGNYPLFQLDPSSPPDIYTPAGQAVHRSVNFIRKQVQLSATERDQLVRRLSEAPSGVLSLDELQVEDQTVAPLPPHFRPPIPERYPEISSETVHIDEDDLEESPAITVGDPLVVTEDEVNNRQIESGETTRMPPITIDREQIQQSSRQPPSPLPNSAVVMPAPSTRTQSRPNLSMALKNVFSQEVLKSTKLMVIVQDYPDGPGLYGLQVKVTCKGIKSYVAGTTDREGKFICELPVREQSGLTYDVAVTWPRSEGGTVESKSITLNADRTRFSLPFYRQLDPPGDSS